MANGGFLCLSGRSLDTAEFSLVSSDIFKSWDRAIKWNTATNTTTFTDVRQTDQFENHALSWNSTNRDPDLLLHADQPLDRAVKLLAQHSEEPMLSPLAKEFLEASVEASKHRIRRRRMLSQVGYPAVAALFIFGLVLLNSSHFSGKSDKAVGKPILKNTDISGLVSSPKAAIPPLVPTVGAIATAPVTPSALLTQSEPVILSELVTPSALLILSEPVTPSAPVIEALSQKPKSKPVLDPELIALAAKIAGTEPPKPAPKPVKKAAPKP